MLKGKRKGGRDESYNFVYDKFFVILFRCLPIILCVGIVDGKIDEEGMRIYADGQNTKTTSVACIVKNTKFKKKMMKVIPYNSDILEVELSALKWAIEIALSLNSNEGEDYKLIEVCSDRQDIVEEFNGGPRVCMLRYREDVQNLIKRLEGKNIKILWCPRELNKAGIALEKRLKLVKRSINNIVSGGGFKKNKRKKKKRRHGF